MRRYISGPTSGLDVLAKRSWICGGGGRLELTIVEAGIGDTSVFSLSAPQKPEGWCCQSAVAQGVSFKVEPTGKPVVTGGSGPGHIGRKYKNLPVVHADIYYGFAEFD